MISIRPYVHPAFCTAHTHFLIKSFVSVVVLKSAFPISRFEFVSDLGIRISNFGRVSVVNLPLPPTPRPRNLNSTGHSRVTIPHQKPYILRPSRLNIATPFVNTSSMKNIFAPMQQRENYPQPDVPPASVIPKSASIRRQYCRLRASLVNLPPVFHHCSTWRTKTLCFPILPLPNRNTHFSRSMKIFPARVACCLLHRPFRAASVSSVPSVLNPPPRPALVAWNSRGTMLAQRACIFRQLLPNIVPSISDFILCAPRHPFTTHAALRCRRLLSAAN